MSDGRMDGAPLERARPDGPVAPDPLRALDVVERKAVAAFESDAWLSRAALADEPAISGELAGYKLVRVVARDLRRTVYEAVDERTGQRVAVRRAARRGGDSPTNPADPASSATRAARATTPPRHPLVAAVIAVVDLDDVRLVISEWIHGEPIDHWSDLVRSMQDPRTAVVKIGQTLAQTARAVAAARAAGAMRGKLAPSRILVQADGTPRLIGSGPIEPEEPREACAGEAHADVVALGLLAYRAFTGRNPVDSSQAIETDTPSIRVIAPDFSDIDRRRLPRSVARVVRHALASDASRRQVDASTLADRLEQALGGGGAADRALEAIDAARGFARRRRTASVAVLLVILATTIALVVAALSDSGGAAR